jgi:hypothetical protein
MLPENQKGNLSAKTSGIFENRENILALLLILGVFLGTFLGFQQLQAKYFPSSSQMLNAAEAWPISARDAFTENQNWLSTDGATAENVKMLFDGRLQIDVKPIETGTREAFFSETAAAPEEFLLSTEVVVPEACHAGLVFRGNLRGEYYLFMADDHIFTVEILQRNASKNEDLPREAILANTPLPKEIKQTENLSVLFDGKAYSFYVNRILVGQMRDSRLTGERVGIEIMVCPGTTQESVFKFDNFTLKVPRP